MNALGSRIAVPASFTLSGAHPPSVPVLPSLSPSVSADLPFFSWASLARKATKDSVNHGFLSGSLFFFEKWDGSFMFWFLILA